MTKRSIVYAKNFAKISTSISEISRFFEELFNLPDAADKSNTRRCHKQKLTLCSHYNGSDTHAVFTLHTTSTLYPVYTIQSVVKPV